MGHSLTSEKRQLKKPKVRKALWPLTEDKICSRFLFSMEARKTNKNTACSTLYARLQTVLQQSVEMALTRKCFV